jgi:hypothetical protein
VFSDATVQSPTLQPVLCIVVSGRMNGSQGAALAYAAFRAISDELVCSSLGARGDKLQHGQPATMFTVRCKYEGPLVWSSERVNGVKRASCSWSTVTFVVFCWRESSFMKKFSFEEEDLTQQFHHMALKVLRRCPDVLSSPPLFTCKTGGTSACCDSARPAANARAIALPAAPRRTAAMKVTPKNTYTG